jgi:hypothetical protein
MATITKTNFVTVTCLAAAAFCVSIAFAAQAHATAYSGSDSTVFNLFGAPLDADVEADCNDDTYCAEPYDYAAYECIAQEGSNQAVCSLNTQHAGQFLSPGDYAFCNVYAQCSDGNTVYDNQWGGGDCVMTCASGAYIQSVGVLVGVGQAS